MAIYHLSVKTISRSAGRSATAAAAYRSGAKIEDEQTGEIHDYTRKGGVESATLVLPTNAPEWASDRAKLWNAAEGAEKRKNSTVAREFEIALPSELNRQERQSLAIEFAKQLVATHGCAADVAIHSPGKEGDNRNHHAHILLTTRRLGPDGLGEKTRELDEKASGAQWVKEWRSRYAELQNQHLSRAGHSARVDHRSLEAQGIERVPEQHLGPTATAIERRTGLSSRLRTRHNEEALKNLQKAKDLGELERQIGTVDQTILDLSADIARAKEHRAVMQSQGVRQGIDQAREAFEVFKRDQAQKALQARQDSERRQQKEAQETARAEAAKRQRQEVEEAQRLAELERARSQNRDFDR